MKKLTEVTILSKEEKEILRLCTKKIRKVDPTAEVILYGSQARGEAGSHSDYDLLVLIDGDTSLVKEDTIRQQLYPIELETGKVFTVNMYNKKDWDTNLYKAMPFHYNVERDGILL